MTAAGWVVAVDKLIETGQIFITDCDANFAVGTTILSARYYVPSGLEKTGPFEGIVHNNGPSCLN